MRHMYYHSFPQAPIELVSGIAAGAGIPSIVGAYVGIDNSVYLDVFINDDFHISANHLRDIAEVCGVTLDELEVAPGIDTEHVTISVVTSCYDFSELFKGTRFDRAEPYAEYTLTCGPFGVISGETMKDALAAIEKAGLNVGQHDYVRDPFFFQNEKLKLQAKYPKHDCSFPGCIDNLPGVEDSEELIEANVKTINRSN